MNELVVSIVQNKMFLTPIAAFLVAQVLKNIIFFFKNKQFKKQYIFTDGGSFSAHTAVMASLTVAILFEQGVSAVFFLAFFVTMIVMRDAYGVRYQTGKQATVINKLIAQLGMHQKNLKELVGHTKTQVVLGTVIGILTALVSYVFF